MCVNETKTGFVKINLKRHTPQISLKAVDRSEA
jgi:hypothetical protein